MLKEASNVAVGLQRYLAAVYLRVRSKHNIGPLGARFTFDEGVWRHISVLHLLWMKAGIVVVLTE